MATSSANPFKLGRYSSDGLALVATLEAQADAVAGALSALEGSVDIADAAPDKQPLVIETIHGSP